MAKKAQATDLSGEKIYLTTLDSSVFCPKYNKMLDEVVTAISETSQASSDGINTHTGNTENPHAVNKEQIGLSEVDNIKQYSETNPPPYPIAKISLNGTELIPDETNSVNIDKILKTDTDNIMESKITAQSNTDYTARQVHNIIFSTAAPTSSDGQNGDIWMVYEA